MERRARELGALALLAGLVVLFWRRGIMAPAHELTFLGSDLFLYYLPMYGAVADAWRAGRLPLWNPFNLCGMPLLATLQVGALYPPHALYLVLPLPGAMAAVAILHLGLAALGAYALARGLGLAPAAGLVAGVGYGLGSPLLAAIFVPNYLEAAAWLPLGLLALLRLRDAIVAGRPAWPWLALWTGAEAASFLAGHTQLWVAFNYAWAAATLCLLARTARRAGAGPALRLAGAVTGGGLLGLALTAAQLLPTLELARQSVRPTAGLTWSQVAPYGDYPYRFIRNSLVAPSQLTDDYLGVVLVLLAPAALVARRARGAAAALFAGGGLVYLMLLGPLTPVHRLFLLLPGLAVFRIPTRLHVLTALASALVAAIAVEEIGRSVRDEPRPRRAALLLAAGGAGLAVALLARLGASPALAVAALSVLTVALVAPHRAAGAIVGLLLALVVSDHLRASRNVILTPYHPQGAALLGRNLERMAALVRDDPLARLAVLGGGFDPGLSPKGGMRARVLRLGDYEPLCPERQAAYVAPASRKASLVPRFATGQVDGVPRPLLDLAGTRTVVVASPAVPRDYLDELLRGMPLRGHLPPTRESGTPPPGPALHDNPSALPRAFAVTDWRVDSDPAAILAALARPDFPLRERALLEEPPPPSHAVPPPPDPGRPAPRVTVRRYAPEEVEVDATVAAPSLLLLTDSHYPGWEATVDGVAAPILRADYLFRAVPLSPGAHTVRFVYRPLSFRGGAAISVAALGVLAALGLAARRRRAHSR